MEFGKAQLLETIVTEVIHCKLHKFIHDVLSARDTIEANSGDGLSTELPPDELLHSWNGPTHLPLEQAHLIEFDRAADGEAALFKDDR